MAHFAQLDENDLVIQVVVINNNDCMLDGEENETIGVLFCKSLFGQDTRWKQTSYNGNIRKNYAGIGFTYDKDRDAFIPPSPYPSWVLNEESCRWEAPIPYPEDTYNTYMWEESSLTWVVTGTRSDVPIVLPDDFPAPYSGSGMPV